MVSRHRLSALGVGVKVVDLRYPESGLSEKHPSDLEGPLSIELLQNRSPQLTLVPNVMQSLMEQGMYAPQFLGSLH